ncbi:copper chaperone PCu(A)C [Pseudomonas sp. NPDC078700]|uniref:copper chaperone PCu(A)C n=1 Tax=Pseudomonas sp. NPDC078700 TaxID=3364424 RepID=UPI0037C66C45
MLNKILLIAALMSSAVVANAHEFDLGNLHIEHPWSREMPPVAPTAAAYFVVDNNGKEADRLIAVHTPVAEKAEMHEHVKAGDVMKMQQVQGVDVPAGGQVRFEPKSYHVMLFGLEQQMKAGEHFPMTLTFEKAGDVEVQVNVQKDAPVAGEAHKH